MAIIRMSRYFDLSNNAVLFHDVMLPVDAFLTTHISEEMTLVNKIFEFAKMIPFFMKLLREDQIVLLKPGGRQTYLTIF